MMIVVIKIMMMIRIKAQQGLRQMLFVDFANFSKLYGCFRHGRTKPNATTPTIESSTAQSGDSSYEPWSERSGDAKIARYVLIRKRRANLLIPLFTGFSNISFILHK